ncbi:thiamine phosphate synthase [Anaerococcus vaginalis]|uniref:thiamine phosphate synthase n=1 Tax=Anaerococcus vaginalis TaxID=33037 RepID=UPI002913FC91|nr:thiamine phosphate synthase [Anaerococcus vaginalis]MDU5252611.1 thiamine phosphate synthase [Anaerococcus vaginalis]MDU6782220.1 thiamine phosphate synthase [Anaerococcus vaginalis]
MKKLYLVTNSDKYSEEEFLERIEDAIKGGVDIVQLREKEKSDIEILNLGKKVKKICDKYDIPLLIDDKVHLAWALGCGVHVGKDDMPIALCRKLLGEKAIIGATAKSVEDSKKAKKDGANYLGVGAIFETKTHVKTKRTSIETLKKIKEEVDIDIYAIGGLNIENVEILKNTKVDGICVVRAIMDAKDVYQTSLELKEKIQEL